MSKLKMLLSLVLIVIIIANTLQAKANVDSLNHSPQNKLKVVVPSSKCNPTFISLKGVTITPVYDSVQMVNAAVLDVAEHFHLKNHDIKNLIETRVSQYSDYFKPSVANTSNPLFLQDSVYVKTYRSQAYFKTLAQPRTHRTVGHWILLGFGIYLLIGIIGAYIAIFILLANFH